MEFVYDVVVVLHFVGLAILLGAVLLQLTSPEKTVTRWMFDGALTQLVTGLIMVGMLSGGLLGDEAKEYVDNTKIAVKLVIVLVIAVLAFVGKKRPAPQTGLWATIGVLTLANVVIAVFW
jgi:hypothetical protein